MYCLTERIKTYKAMSQHLSLLSDENLTKLLESAEQKNINSWGKVFSLAIAGAPVFVKKVPLTDFERQQENWQNTSNISMALPSEEAISRARS